MANSRYPIAIDVDLPIVVDNRTGLTGSISNSLRSAILAVESELGIKPSGNYGTVVARLQALDSAINALEVSGAVPGSPNRSIQINDNGVFNSLNWLNPFGTSHLQTPQGATLYAIKTDGSTQGALIKSFNATGNADGPDGLYIGQDGTDIGFDTIQIWGNRSAGFYTPPTIPSSNVFGRAYLLGTSFRKLDNTNAQVTGFDITPNILLHSAHAENTIDNTLWGGGLGVFQFDESRQVPTTNPVDGNTVLFYVQNNTYKARHSTGSKIRTLSPYIGFDTDANIATSGDLRLPKGTQDVFSWTVKKRNFTNTRDVMVMGTFSSSDSVKKEVVYFGGDDSETGQGADSSVLVGIKEAVVGLDNSAASLGVSKLSGTNNTHSFAGPNLVIQNGSFNDNGTSRFGGGLGVLRLDHANPVPSTNIIDGILLYSDPNDYRLKYRQPDGTIVDPVSSASVSGDIVKSDGYTINRVVGLHGYSLVKSDGYTFVEGVNSPDIGATPVYNEINGTSFKFKKPVPQGWFNFEDYGARPSHVDSPTPFDCTDALLAAIQAANPKGYDLDGYARSAIVYIPPAPDGYEWYVAGKVNNNFGPMPHIEVDRMVKILGVGGVGLRGGSRIKFGPLCAGFRPVGLQGSSTGGDGSGSIFEGLHTFCTPISQTSIQLGWQSNHSYTKGDKIRPYRFHNLYYECLKTGNSNGPTPSIGDCSRYAVNDHLGTYIMPSPGNRWRPGATYSPGNKVYPNTECGKIFVCTVGGTTEGLSREAGTESQSEVFPAGNRPSSAGEPDWFTDPSSPTTSIVSSVREALSGVTWVPSETDPEPIWHIDGSVPCLADFFKPNHPYNNGAWVFGPNLDRIFVAYITPPATQTSGASPPAGWSTAKYPTEVGYVAGDDVVVDGAITWYCIAPVGMIQDGYTVWAARVAAAYSIYAPAVEISKPFVKNSPTCGIGLFSIVTPTQFLASDVARIIGPGQIESNGVGIYAVGGDSNACNIEHLFMLGDSADYWGDPADHCVDDASFLGNHYRGIIFQGCGGWAIGFRGQSGSSTMSSCYIEGNGRKGPITGACQIGGAGTVQALMFRLGTVDINSANSGLGPMIFKDKCVNMSEITHSDSPEGFEVRSALSGGRGASFGFQATNAISPGTNDDPLGYAWSWGTGFSANHWCMLHRGSSRDAFFISGQNASDGPATVWFRKGFKLGGGAFTPWLFGDADSFASIHVKAAVRDKGDFTFRPDRAARGQYLERVVLDSGNKVGYTWNSAANVGLGDIYIPTTANSTLNHRAFQCTSLGSAPHSVGAVEPNWNDTLGGTTTDGYITWTTIAGSDLGLVGLVEDGCIKYNIQPNTLWADGYDTHTSVAVPKTSVKQRRGQKQTTTNTASQVLDDGIQNSQTRNLDLTLSTDSITEVSATLLVKQNGTTEAGSIKLSGTFYRNSSSAPVRVGTDDNTSKLSSGLSGVTAALVINGNAIEIQVSPGSTLTLDWRWTRVHTEGKS